ncbi:MAG: type I-B CRISPR-associated protein Cas8b/Csh1, partial [Candidatus Hodarchaeota archaeon]
FLDKYLFKKFYGYNFYIIPKFIFGEIQDEFLEDIMNAGSREELMSLLEEEDEILDLMKDTKNFVNLIFVFCRRKQIYFDIVKYIEDVPPSWIKTIYDKFKEITLKKSLFKEEFLKIFMGKNWTNDFIRGIWKGKRLRNNLGGMIRSFFPSSKETGIYNKYLLDIVGDILGERPINEQILINAFMREIRNQFVNDFSWMEKILVLKSLYVYTLLKELKLLKNGGNLMKNNKLKPNNSNISEKRDKIERYFSEFENAFDRPEKKALFSEGVLAKFLLDIQFAKRGAKPFREKLYGLKLEENRVKKLLPEIIEKLRQYDIGYPWLEQLISEYMIEADNNGWRLTKDEISYYFTLGLNLAKMFKKKKESENNE